MIGRPGLPGSESAAATTVVANSGLWTLGFKDAWSQLGHPASYATSCSFNTQLARSNFGPRKVIADNHFNLPQRFV